jgi:hypothetical protein
MAYSAKKRWLMEGGALALPFGGGALILMLKHSHFDPAVITLLFTLVSLAACGMGMWAYSYMDEVQRQTQQTRWFWGSIIGFTAMAPVALALVSPSTAWLDTAIHFFFHRPGTPRLYFAFGVLLPLVFQVAGYALKLLGKLPRGSNI